MKTTKTLSFLLILTISSQLSFSQNITADTTLANKHFETAQEYYKNKSYDTAIVCFEKASVLYQEHKQWRKYLQSETKHGQCYQKLWQLNLAIATIKPAIEKSLQYINENDAIVADAYQKLGFQYVYQSKYDTTLLYWKKSLQISKKILGKKHITVARLCNNIGNVYADKNEYSLALQYYLKSLQIKIELLSENHIDLATSYGNIGVVYWEKNEYDLALEYHFKSLQIYIELLGKKNTDVALTYNNIGIVYWNKNEYDLALQYYFKSLQIKKELLGEKHTSVALTYDNIGNVYLWKEEFGLALEYHFNALQIYKEQLGEKNILVAKSYGNIGDVYNDKNEYNLTLQYYQKAMASCLKKFNDTVNVYSVPLIKDYINWNYLLQALQVKAEIITILSAVENPDKGLDSLQQKPLSGFINSDRAELLKTALRHYQACDTLISQVRKEIKTKSDKIALGEQASEVYKGAVNVCLNLSVSSSSRQIGTGSDSVSYYNNLAFYFSEKNKSSVLLEALAGAEAQKFAGIPDTLLEKEYKLQIDITLYKKILAEQPDSAKEILFRDKLFKANRLYDEMIIVFEGRYPEYFELKYNRKPASVKEIQKILDDKTAMISYFTGDSIITIFTITKKNLEIKTFTAIENFADTIRDYRNGLIYTSSSSFAKVYKKYAYKMYRQLIPENVYKKINNLIIIPDAELSMIPFETLLTENPGDKEWKELPYLVKKYNISYSYSANLFYKTIPKEPTTKIEYTDLNDWLAFAPVFDDSNTAGLTMRTRELLQQLDTKLDDTTGTRGILDRGGYVSPLPGTESEVLAIFKQFDKKGKKALVQIRKNANEEFIKSGELKKYKLLHFATHGFVNTWKPELSGIFLAQDSTINEDGILYSGEIYNLKLNANLTVLSACETGLGEIKKGEGLIGLTRALLYAGSKNIIVSLWKVADNSTSDLMIDFYENLLEAKQEKQEFSKALQQAKLKMIDEGKYAHPFYWSPFILIGK